MSTLDILFSGFFRRETAVGRSEEERIADILKIAESCPTGKKVLDDARDRHPRLKIRLVPGMEHMGGYNPRGWTISLNPSFCDEKLVTTLIHEASHSLQDETIFEPANLKSMIMATRACEADASAHEAAVATELGGKVREEYARMHPGIYRAYSQTLQESGDSRRAFAEAFKAWYDVRPYVALYDARVLKYANKLDHIMPSTEFTPEKILRSAVPADAEGKRYVTEDASFLTEKRFLTLSRKTLFKARYVSLMYGDGSLNGTFVEGKDGTVKPYRSISLKRTLKSLVGVDKGRGA